LVLLNGNMFNNVIFRSTFVLCALNIVPETWLLYIPRKRMVWRCWHLRQRTKNLSRPLKTVFLWSRRIWPKSSPATLKTNNLFASWSNSGVSCTSAKWDCQAQWYGLENHLHFIGSHFQEGIVNASDLNTSICGHKFVVQRRKSLGATTRFCDKCGQSIWALMHSSYKCQMCGYYCHARCLNVVTRICASLKVCFVWFGFIHCLKCVYFFWNFGNAEL